MGRCPRKGEAGRERQFDAHDPSVGDADLSQLRWGGSATAIRNDHGRG